MKTQAIDAISDYCEDMAPPGGMASREEENVVKIVVLWKKKWKKDIKTTVKAYESMTTKDGM